VYYGGSVRTVAIDDDIIDDSKYSVSKNTLTGLYYRLHILNVGVSDLTKYKCQGLVNGVNQYFYTLLDILGVHDGIKFTYNDQLDHHLST
jgi:hypothetical protein